MKDLESRFAILVESMENRYTREEIIYSSCLLGATAIRIRNQHGERKNVKDCLSVIYEKTQELKYLAMGEINYLDIFKGGKEYLDQIQEKISDLEEF